MKKARAITLRQVSLADGQLLFAWRNDPEARRNSRSVEPVRWKDHEAWLSRMLGAPDCVIRIVEADGRPVGVVRADRAADGWELSWTVAPDARGHGVGRSMLTMFVTGLDGRLIAVIRKDNVASARIAAAAGLSRLGLADDPDFERWTRE
jgi:RimJ/RimL family protein N-acetyltransferase